MALTTEQLEAVRTGMEAGKPIPKIREDEGYEDTVQQIRQQMREHFGVETWNAILDAMRQALQGAAFYRRIDMITSRINSGVISVNQSLKDSVAALKTEVDSH